MAATTTQWILELVDKITAPMKTILDAAKEAASAVDGVGESADESKEKVGKMSAIDLYAVKDAVQSLADDFNKLNAPGAAFNAQMKELEAITGITGDALGELGDKGREIAVDFGGDASAQLESFKGILSRLGPDIAKDQGALELMGRNIAILSKTMGNDALGSMDALTTSMLQFGIDLSNPQQAALEMTRLMNVMAAGAKEGASEVPQISEALKQAGVQALNSNVSFEQTNAALQALAQGGKYGSEAGVALRNVLGKMAGIDVIPKEAAEKLEALGVNYDIVANKSLPFTDRLRELKKAQGDATIMAQIFGTENAAAAEILLRSVDYQDELTNKITGTNTAQEQANIIMSGYPETMSRVKAWFTDLAIGAFDVTSKITPMVDGLAGAVSIFANLANAKQGITLLFNTLKTMPVIGKIVAFGSSIASGGFAAMSTAAKGLGVAIMNIPIIGWIAAIIAGLIALGAYLWKTSATFRGVLMGVWEFIKVFFTGYYKFIWEVLTAIWNLIKQVFNPKNWFDPNFSFADTFKKAAGDIMGAAKDYGNNLGKAYAEGKKKGEESYYKDHPEKKPGLEATNIETGSPLKIKDGPSALLNPTDLNQKKRSGMVSELKGTGGGSAIKNITQKIDMKNYFTISSGGMQAEIDGIAEKVVRALNDKLRDGMVAVAS